MEDLETSGREEIQEEPESLIRNLTLAPGNLSFSDSRSRTALISSPYFSRREVLGPPVNPADAPGEVALQSLTGGVVSRSNFGPHRSLRREGAAPFHRGAKGL